MNIADDLCSAFDEGYARGYEDARHEYDNGQGHWVRTYGYATPGGDPVWSCSECGKGIHVYGIEHGSYGADISDGQWVACPNCGARMLE